MTEKRARSIGGLFLEFWAMVEAILLTACQSSATDPRPDSHC